MPDRLDTFSALLAPLGEAQFFAEIYHRRPVHVPGGAAKAAQTFSWSALNTLLAMDVWDPSTLQLVLDRQRIPPASYSRNVLNRGQRQVMRPDAGKVMALIEDGASLVLNNVETLHPGILAVAEAIAARVGGKVSANLYCSWQSHQAFDSHYDRHEVYALQIDGEKVWQIYEGRMNTPIEHAAFYNIPQEDCDRMKGKVAATVTLRPGDLLYLPRGQFHDALASAEASIHLTFGCSEPTGLDWLSQLWERAVMDPAFRADLPRLDRPEDEAAFRAHAEMLIRRMSAAALDPHGLETAKALRKSFGLKRETYALPRKKT